ncbi:type II toxin-antitoxin system HipA family toxin [Phenylobacterium sp. Root700]|uniref:type II toxin-antitoxin system HipA family toxin n=1 Tax=Phenylobacterium sp. Root700 TaxID=1736591 RepID=UPI0006F6BD0E|nr:type II toxin-antitoxin system HipA family toxin [Phenylobacterium sp. Root700]KRB52630.1 phosphatidylinositol kinase [Phenylobacterium sp. Root700]
MEREIEVHIDWNGATRPVGRLWARAKGARQTCSFAYAPTWLGLTGAFALDPNLPLVRGDVHWDGGLFNAFSDPAPDRWGRNLMGRRERHQAKHEGRAPRTLLEADFLMLVEDQTRLGALRFRDMGAQAFQAADARPVPPLVALPKLLGAARRILDDTETDEDLRLLLAPGSSLGGARPKASVLGADGRLLMAKFPSQTDDWPIPTWESVAMTLAKLAGVIVPAFQLRQAARRPVFMMSRFDRTPDGGRRPFCSALTALGAADGETRSYMELVDFLRQDGADAPGDAAQLWRRMVFNILISNNDDHLRNHGFLREPDGWRLSPAYDLNPMPADVKPRIHALALNETDQDASLDTVLGVAGHFRLGMAEARAIAREVGDVVAAWRDVAAQHSLTANQIDRMASAFETNDLAAARV